MKFNKRVEGGVYLLRAYGRLKQGTPYLEI